MRRINATLVEGGARSSGVEACKQELRSPLGQLVYEWHAVPVVQLVHAVVYPLVDLPRLLVRGGEVLERRVKVRRPRARGHENAQGATDGTELRHPARGVRQTDRGGLALDGKATREYRVLYFL